MSERARIRISLAQRELEIEGSEGFVRSFGDRLERMLERLSSGEPVTVRTPEVRRSGLGGFGEFLHHLPGTATDVDRMLAAGFYVQEHSPDRTFATAEASRRLSEQGIKIGNPSQCVRQSQMAKRVFIVERGRYRVSQIGRQHLRQLMGDVIGEDAGGLDPGRGGA